MDKLKNIATSLGSHENIEEAKALIKISVPLILSQLLFIFGFQQGVLFCGHLGEAELDAAGLAFTLIHVFGTSVAMGLFYASDTLMALHFGSTNKQQVGVVFQRSLWIAAITTIICTGCLLNVGWLMKLTGQIPEVAILTTQYVKWYCLGLPAFILNLQLQKLLACQSIIWPILVMFVVLNVGIAVFHCLFLYVFYLGIVGSALAISLGFWVADIFLIGLIIWRRLHVEIWGGWTKASLLEWWPYVKLGLPGLGMSCLEFSTFEIVTFMSGLLGEIQLGAQIVTFQLEVLMFMFPFGFGTASSIRVGNSLGGRDHVAARRVFILSSIMTAITALCVGSIVAAAHSAIPHIYTDSPEIIKVAAAVIPQLLPFHLFDAMQGSLGGVIRGCGRQVTGAFVAFIGYIVLGLPIALSLMFATSMKLQGLWLGMNVGGFFQTVFYLIFFWRLNWENEAKTAGERIEQEHQVEETVNGTASIETSSFESSRLLKEPHTSNSVKRSKAGLGTGELPNNYGGASEKPGSEMSNGQDYDGSNSFPQKDNDSGHSFSLKWFLMYRAPVIGGSLLFLSIAIYLSLFWSPDFQPANGNNTAT